MMLPKQKMSTASKLKKDHFGRCPMYDTIDYYISQVGYNNHIEEMTRLRDVVHGILYLNDYKQFTNPFNMKTGVDGAAPRFNAQLRNHNILKGIVNLLLGEFGRRSHEYIVTDASPEKESVYLDKLTEALKGYYQQQVINELNTLGFPTGLESQELPTLEQYKEDFTNSYNEQHIITGQEALDYIRYNQDIDSKYLDAYWNWVVYGRFYTYKGIINDEVVFDIVPVFEMFTPYQTHSRYVEDRSWAVRKRKVSPAELIDLFRGDIPDDLLDLMDSEFSGLGGMDNINFTVPTGKGGYMALPTVYADSVGTSAIDMTNGIDLYHVQFKTWTKVGILTFIDPLGQKRQIEVDETYKLDKSLGDISIKWEYINEVWQAYKCNDYYLRMEPLLENRAELNNSSVQKLGYNGIEERSPNGGIQSIIKEGEDFQKSINILHYQAEKIINKNKDKLVVMPYGMIPRKQGLSEKDVMYHADATSILWVDETSPNAGHAAQMIKVLDMSLGAYIKDILEIINYIKQEYWDTIGMNAQRYSDVGQNAGKGTTETAIVRSAIITAELTRQFDSVVEKDYQGFLDLSKLAWVNGKKGQYIRSDGSIGFINLNADDVIYHTSSSYGVFVKSAFDNTEARDALRALSQPLIQNGAQASAVAKLWSTNSVTKITKIIEKIEAHNLKNAELIRQSEAENAQALQQMINENDLANREIQMYVSDNNLKGVMYTADKRTESNKRSEPQPPKQPNEVDIALANHKIQNDNVKANQKEQEIRIKEKMSNKPNTVKK